MVGRCVLLPAGLINGMSPDEESVETQLTQDQIKDSPTSDPDLGDITRQQHRDDVAAYFEELSP